MGRKGRALRHVLCASVVSLALAGASTPAMASPSAGLYRVKRPKVTPADAAAKRAEAETRGGALLEAGEAIDAGIEFDNAAAEFGDPVLYLDAGEAYLEAGRTSRNPELAEASIERAKISLDILYFHLDSAADENFRLVESSEVPTLIVRAQTLIEDAEALIEEIEAEQAAEDAPAQTAADEPEAKNPGRVAKIAGGALIGAGVAMLGVGGVGLALGARHQQTAEHSTVYGEEYDAVAAKGERANLLAYIGIPTGLVLAGAGVAVLVIAGKKGKKGGDTYSVVPTFDRYGSGVAVSGRF